MKLPNANKVIISKSKITEYILSETHQLGKHKAKFFKQFGFELNKHTVFKKMLKKMASETAVKKEVKTAFGVKFELEGKIETPSEARVKVKAVWTA